jgi:hypothetical protein
MLWLEQTVSRWQSPAASQQRRLRHWAHIVAPAATMQ